MSSTTLNRPSGNGSSTVSLPSHGVFVFPVLSLLRRLEPLVLEISHPQPAGQMLKTGSHKAHPLARAWETVPGRHQVASGEITQ